MNESKLVENAIALADNTCSTTVLKKSIGRIWGLKKAQSQNLWDLGFRT